MTSYLRRARSALHEFLHGREPQPPAAAPVEGPPVPAVPVGNNLIADRKGIAFADAALATSRPVSWLDAFEAALTRNAPLSPGAIAAMRHSITDLPADQLLPPDSSRRFLDLLRPRPGLAARLSDLDRAGVLGALLPATVFARSRADREKPVTSESRALAAIESLERVMTDSSLIGERFGSMLREISAPELLVVTLLLHDPRIGRDNSEPVFRGVPAVLGIDPEGTRKIDFLIRHQLEMSLLAFRQDTQDPAIVGTFASMFSMEEELKMLCLITVADLGAMGAGALSPWKAELLWRLFVDTYNHMTMTYGDEVIDSHGAAAKTLESNRPHDISEDEMRTFLEGLPRRYLTLFDPENIYRHVRLSRELRPDDVHYVLNKRNDVWELTVVTLDKSGLFANICGVLSYLGFDILRGYAFTSPNDIVLDIFQFTDHKGCLVRPQLDPLLSDVVSGRADISALLKQRETAPTKAHPTVSSTTVYFDNDSSTRYTILELVTEDAPGLLHRVSRIISQRGCAVDLVLISTQGEKAIDVFHLRKASAKLTESDTLTLTEDFEREFSSSNTQNS